MSTRVCVVHTGAGSSLKVTRRPAVGVEPLLAMRAGFRPRGWRA
ncbi:hypothetical protein SBD_0571 [Streptomyces bottropensis ATCC 25435]|uniref:Uncharacterized protein n=1 Tax=Streptomyces bottropensis ATCC 25435 TaxID=1054862 RepID=M3F8A8_9ACTN|nr:hypothetical protein SBD_0571 [Streptomyces bottropensis ATCC 25435]